MTRPIIVLSLAITGMLVGATMSMAAPVGVDGVIGAEWIGVTPVHVPYGPAAPDGHLVAFDVYARTDSDYFYVGLQALPAAGDQWDDALDLGLGSSANLYIDTDPPNSNGSDVVFLPLGGFNFGQSYGDPDLNVEIDMAGHTLIFTAYDEGDPNPTPVGGVREFAFDWDLFRFDPDNVGFPTLNVGNPSLTLRTVQAFGYNFSGSQFDPERFGTFTDPNPVPEPASLALAGMAIIGLGVAAMARRFGRKPRAADPVDGR